MYKENEVIAYLFHLFVTLRYLVGLIDDLWSAYSMENRICENFPIYESLLIELS